MPLLNMHLIQPKSDGEGGGRGYTCNYDYTPTLHSPSCVLSTC